MSVQCNYKSVVDVFMLACCFFLVHMACDMLLLVLCHHRGETGKQAINFLPIDQAVGLLLADCIAFLYLKRSQQQQLPWQLPWRQLLLQPARHGLPWKSQ